MQRATSKPSGVRRKGKVNDGSSMSEDSRPLTQSGSRKRVRFASKEGEVTFDREDPSLSRTDTGPSGATTQRAEGLCRPNGVTGVQLAHLEEQEETSREELRIGDDSQDARRPETNDAKADGSIEICEAEHDVAEDRDPEKQEEGESRETPASSRILRIQARLALEPLTISRLTPSFLERRPSAAPSGSTSRSHSFDDTVMREVDDLVAMLPQMRLERSRSEVEILMKRRQLLGTCLGTPRSGTSPQLPRTKSF